MIQSTTRLSVKRNHLIVVGGGAAGFFCAVNAARLNPDLEVTIVEKTTKLLSKVKISGGGRCNLTHAMFDITEMSKRYPRGENFVKKTFHRFFTADTVKWFEERGIPLKTEKDGRMFPVSDSSQTVIDCLVKEANRYCVVIRMNADVKELKVGDHCFTIRLGNDELLNADFVCLAIGGYPKASMFEWLNNLGHAISPPVPSLFTFNLPKHPLTRLMGVSLEKLRVKIEGTKLVEEGPAIITHWGLSGPAVLRLSAWGAKELAAMGYEFSIRINWLPDFHEHGLKEVFQNFRKAHSSKKVGNHNIGQLPGRLWQFLLQISGVEEEWRFAELPSKIENVLIGNLANYSIPVKGKTSFKEEFVTAGGINLSEVNAHTMMSKKIPNLFFAGEILDVDGITGGFNFQHAWTSGWIAAETIAQKGKDN